MVIKADTTIADAPKTMVDRDTVAMVTAELITTRAVNGISGITDQGNMSLIGTAGAVATMTLIAADERVSTGSIGVQVTQRSLAVTAIIVIADTGHIDIVRDVLMTKSMTVGDEPLAIFADSPMDPAVAIDTNNRLPIGAPLLCRQDESQARLRQSHDP